MIGCEPVEKMVLSVTERDNPLPDLWGRTLKFCRAYITTPPNNRLRLVSSPTPRHRTLRALFTLAVYRKNGSYASEMPPIDLVMISDDDEPDPQQTLSRGQHSVPQYLQSVID